MTAQQKCTGSNIECLAVFCICYVLPSSHKLFHGKVLCTVSLIYIVCPRIDYERETLFYLLIYEKKLLLLKKSTERSNSKKFYCWETTVQLEKLHLKKLFGIF